MNASLLISYCVLLAAVAPQKPAMDLIENGQPGIAVLNNGGFERLDNGAPSGWRPYEQGGRIESGSGRSDTKAISMTSSSEDSRMGFSASIGLGRTVAAPLVVRGWSKAVNVSGSRDSGYSIYVDIVYNDDTTLWGRTGNYRCGSHDWEEARFVIQPSKPVKTMTVYCLFRGHSGTVWFDDISIHELTDKPGMLCLQGLPVSVQAASKAAPGRSVTASSHDGLKIAMRQGRVTSLRIDCREFGNNLPSGYMARDVAAGTGYYSFQDGVCEPLGLKLESSIKGIDGHIGFYGRLIDTTGKDRGINLIYALPVQTDKQWRWGDYIRRERTIEGAGEYSKSVEIGCGSTGGMAEYPVACIYNGKVGLALGMDLANPAVYRLLYHAGAKQFIVSYDFGLVPETKHFPSAAEFGFVAFRFDPQWGFRSAFDRYMKIFPEKFWVRSKEQGIWMPFTDVSKVQNWQDFGFKYHEGNNNVPFDDESGILSFRYTEPMTWWMPMPQSVARTSAEAERIRNELAAKGSPDQQRMAKAVESAGMRDDQGEPALIYRNEPWCNGAVWSLNPNPKLPGEWNGANIYWNKSIQTNLYGRNARGALDGEYLDSIEGYVTADLDYRRDHFIHAQSPLTFDSAAFRPALFKGLEVNAFAKWLSEDVHRLGGLMFANSVPYRFSFLCPWLDIMGTETDWMPGGKFHPSSDEQMSLWRTMSGAKPYLLLMNTQFDRFGAKEVELYFQRCLFYGIYPSMFSHNASQNPYWENPVWYNRDRSLFKKYQPLIRQTAQAGWQPITAARCANANVWLERFGDGKNGPCWLTLYNDSKETQSGLVTLDSAVLPKIPVKMVDQVAGTQFEIKANRFTVHIEPGRVLVFKIERPSSLSKKTVSQPPSRQN